MQWEKYDQNYSYAIGDITPRPWGHEILMTVQAQQTKEELNAALAFKEKPDKEEIQKAIAKTINRIILQKKNGEAETKEDKIYTEEYILNALKSKGLISESTDHITDDFIDKLKESILNKSKE